ncbi:hypothetical protein MNAB215_2397, partial [Mycobacterium numidiamassiliense]
VAGVGGSGVPSLSEVQAWDVAHLESAASNWKATAELWESSFSSIHRASVSPGGAVWEGVAAEAAQERAFADLVKVRGLADVLHESAAIARRGAETLDSAKRSVLDAVEEADSAGYVVGENLSVAPPRGGMAAQAQAQLYAATIQDRAAQLVAQDKAIAAKIATASAPLNSVSFPEPQESLPARALGAGFKLDHEWDPYTDQPAHGPFEPVTPAPPQYDPKTGTVQGGGGGGGPIGGKGGFGTGGEDGGGEPQNVRDTLQQIDAGRWPGSANAPGTKGGSRWDNDPPEPGQHRPLPTTDSSGKPIIYQEWDVNPKGSGNRDSERIVTGNDGSAWYTTDHYRTLHRIR